MQQDTLYKTVYQYNKTPLPPLDMEKLAEIAQDYRQVKNAVYQRYGGIQSLPKLYPGYTVQNEMTKSGLREQMGLPSVYFYSAIFDALGDIKCQWSHTKNRIETCIRDNPNLTPAERHYLRFVMKQSQCLEAILLEREMHLPAAWRKSYEAVRADITEEHRLQQYLRRQVRRHLKKMHTDTANGFSVPVKGYRYDDHGIYITTKERGQRVFVPLTDSNAYSRQLYVQLDINEGNLKISVPIETRIRKHPEYQNEIGLAMGMKVMFVTDQGTIYGKDYGIHQTALTEYIREGARRYRQNKQNNPGRKKYLAGRQRREATLHNYVNAEINRMLETEKPGVVYLPKLPPVSGAGINKKINYSVSMWQKGYVRKRLEIKCRERAIPLIEVFGKGIGKKCSRCKADGERQQELFVCPACGLTLPEKENAAKNALQRGNAQAGNT